MIKYNHRNKKTTTKQEGTDMTKKLYDIKDFEEKSIVYETRRQKDILDILDEMLENAEMFGWAYIRNI